MLYTCTYYIYKYIFFFKLKYIYSWIGNTTTYISRSSFKVHQHAIILNIIIYSFQPCIGNPFKIQLTKLAAKSLNVCICAYDSGGIAVPIPVNRARLTFGYVLMWNAPFWWPRIIPASSRAPCVAIWHKGLRARQRATGGARKLTRLLSSLPWVCQAIYKYKYMYM